MAEVSEEMILDYLLKKGGVVRNVDLVRHFRKYLQIESASEKERARVIFKERVNRVASIKADTKQEKYLYLRPEYFPPGLTNPSTGRSRAADHASVSSLDDVASHASQGANRFSISSILSEAPSIRSPSSVRDSDTDVVAHSFAPIASPPPRTTTITPPSATPSPRTPTVVSPSSKTPPTHQAPPTATPSTMSTLGNSQLKGLGDDDFGASLMAEFNFSSMLDSFGISDKTTSSKPSSTSSSSALSSSSSGNPTVGGSSSKYGIPSKTSYSSSSAAPAAQTSTNSYSNYASNSASAKPSNSSYSNYASNSASANSSYSNYASNSTAAKPSSSPAKSSYSNYSNYASNSAAAKPSSNTSSPAKSSYSNYSNYAANSTAGSKPTSYSNYDNSSTTTAKPSSSSYGNYDNSSTTTAKPSSSSYGNYDNSSNSSGTTAKSSSSSYSSYDSHLAPQQSSTSYSSYGSATSTTSASVSAPTTQPSTSAYNALPAGMRPNPTPYTPPMRTSPAPQRTSPAPQRTSPAPQTVPTSTPQHTPSPHSSTSSTPQKQAPTHKPTSSSNGLPKGGGDLDLTDILSSLPSAKTKKPAKPASGRGQTGDMDLTDVLSSLPSANKPPSGAGRAPGRTGTTFTSAKPPMHSSFQNSTRFPQPQATPAQPSFQNSTKFPQPQAPPTQTSFQNSTRFQQPQAPPTQSNFQNSTRFSQPQAPPTQAMPTQNSFQNSTRFAQPQAPPSQPQAPPTQGYQMNNTQAQQGPPTQPQAQGLSNGGSNWSALTSSDRGNQPSTSVSSGLQNQEPSGSQRRPGPPAPTRSSSISRGSSQSSVPLSTDQRATTTSRRTAPLPPTPKHTTTPQPHPSTDTTHPPSPGHASLGNIDLGDLASSMFSTSAGSHSASSRHTSLSPHNSETSLGHTHHGEEPGKTAEPHSLGPSVSVPPSNGGRGMSTLERRQLSGDMTSGGHLRQGSTDSTPGTPTIRVESPTGASANGSPSHKRGKSPPYSEGGRGRMSSFTSAGSGLGVQLRNKEGKRNTNVAARRSKNMEKQAGNLDSITRLSISMTPPAVRKHRPPPEVAPKPPRSPSSPSPSYDSRNQGSLEGEDDLHSEYDYEEIDPLEKEWMLACAQADIDALQRLMMTDSSLLNRRGFLHGYTALHWAAKHGRMDILSMLLLQGATPDIRSTGGLTPLHLAAQAGHDNILEILVSEHNANISLRENGGRRAIDMLNNKVSDRVRGLLSKLHNHGMPVKVENQQLPATFSRPRENRHWKPLGEIMQHHAPEAKISKKRRGTNLMKSISFKRDNKIKDHVHNSPKKVKTKKGRPVSGAVPEQDKPSKRSSGSRPHSEANRFDV